MNMSEPDRDADFFPEPRDVELEQACLGALLLDNRRIEGVATLLKPEHFSEPLHQRVFDAIVSMAKVGRDVTPFVLKKIFEHDPAIKALGNPNYLIDIVRVPPIADATQFAGAIFDMAKRREIASIGKSLVDSSVNLPIDESPVGLIERASADLMDLDLKAAKQDTLFAGQAARVAIDAAWKAKTTDKTPGLSFGLADVDKAIGGAHAGDMIVIAGRPGMGKSAVCGTIGRNVAMGGGGVLYISCEMTSEQLGRRLISDIVQLEGHNLPYQALRAGKIDQFQKDYADAAASAIESIPFVIDDRRKPPLSQIIASSKRAARRFETSGTGLRLIIVDHMQLIAAPSEYKGNRVSEVTEISGELKALARDLNVPVIACSQLNRDLEGRDVKDKRPTLRDLRDSGAIEQDADIVILLFREEYYHLMKRPNRRDEPASFAAWEPGYKACENQLDFIIAKNREGEPGTVKTRCIMSHSAIRDWKGYA